jgi:hypothetical protein
MEKKFLKDTNFHIPLSSGTGKATLKTANCRIYCADPFILIRQRAGTGNLDYIAGIPPVLFLNKATG